MAWRLFWWTAQTIGLPLWAWRSFDMEAGNLAIEEAGLQYFLDAGFY